MTTVPQMSDLYRQLLNRLTGTFGGKIDDANADAIAYAAAELYHRDFEPRLWEEKSAHDLLDLFGVPRAGVFSPYSLSERVVIFQRRSTQADYVNRAHDLLTAEYTLTMPAKLVLGDHENQGRAAVTVGPLVLAADEGHNPTLKPIQRCTLAIDDPARFQIRRIEGAGVAG